MDDDVFLQIIMLVLLVTGACYCAASEIAFASMNRVRMQSESKKGNFKAKNALFIVENFDKALITLLIGNNLSHIGFASLSTLMATKLWGIGSVKYTTLVATIILFFMSELLPKSYAKANSEKFALNVSGSLLKLMKIFSPISRVFSLISIVLEKILPEKQEEKMSDEGLIDMIDVAHAEGSLDEDETQLVKRAIQFEKKKVKDVYIELKNVEMIDSELNKDEIVEVVKKSKYSRIPVYNRPKGTILGILNTSLYLKKILGNKPTNLNDTISPPIYVYEDKLINDLFTQLNTNKFHMAVVRDKNNKNIGIVSLEDIIEELVGEIWDESDFDYVGTLNKEKSKNKLA